MLRLLAVSAALLGGAAVHAQDHGNHGKGFLPAFTGIDVGFRGCMPLSVLIQSGNDYRFDVTGLEVRRPGRAAEKTVFLIEVVMPNDVCHGHPRRAQAEVADLINAYVSPDGTAIVSVRPLVVWNLIKCRQSCGLSSAGRPACECRMGVNARQHASAALAPPLA